MQLSATDDSNNTNRIFLDIVVAGDGTPPTLLLLQNPLVVEAGVPFDLSFPTVEVIDAIENLRPYLTSNATAGLTDALGTYTVKLELSQADSDGDVAEPVYLQVVVDDTQGPVRRDFITSDTTGGNWLRITMRTH